MKRRVFVAVASLSIVIATLLFFYSKFKIQMSARYPVNTKIVYALNWSSKTDTELPSGAESPNATTGMQSVQLHVNAEYSVRVINSNSEKVQLCAGFTRISEINVSVFGESVSTTNADGTSIFLGHEGCFTLNNRGQLLHFTFDEQSPLLFQQVFQGVASALQFTEPAADELVWQGEERTPMGVAKTDYIRLANRPNELIWTKKQYNSFNGLPPWVKTDSASVEVNGSVTLDELPGVNQHSATEVVSVNNAADELAYVSQMKLSATRLRVDQDDGQYVLGSSVKTYQPNEHIGVKAAQESVEAQYAAKTSVDAIKQVVHSYSGGQLSADQMLAMTTYLRRNPSACFDLAKTLLGSDVNFAKRTLIVDLLVAASTLESQQALRDALRSPELAKDEETRAMGLQRFALLRTPTTDSATFLREEIESASSRGAEQSKHAALISLGSLAGRLRASGEDPAVIAMAISAINKTLHDAQSTQEQVAALVALGGTHDPQQVETISNFRQHQDEHVRAGAAAALGYIQSREANAILFDMANDKTDMVARMALQPLTKREFDAEQRSTLEKLVSQGQTNSAADNMLAAVVARQADADPTATRRMLNALLTRQDPSGELAMSLRRMIAAFENGE